MLPRIKERISEILFSSQLWIAILGSFFSLTFIGGFFDLGFIKLHVVQPELKHLILKEFIIILIYTIFMIIPGFLAKNIYEDKTWNLSQKNMAISRKKKIRLETVKQQIKFRRATNTVLFPFIIFLNPFSLKQLLEDQYLLMGLTIVIALIFWMILDFIFYAKLYIRYFRIKNIENKIGHTIKNSINANIILLRVYILIVNLSIFSLIAQKSILLENNFSTYQDYLEVLTFELAFLLPSMIIMYFRGIKRWIYGLFSAIFICCLLLAHINEIFMPWLSQNHISDFEDYKFIFTKKACDDLEFSKIKLIKSSTQTCQIATDYKVLSAVGDFFRIKIENDDRSSSIEDIRKKDTRHISEIIRQNPKQKDLDEVVKLFSKFYNVPLLVAMHHWQEDTIQSQNNITNNKVIFSKPNDKSIFLAINLNHMNGLVKLTDKAFYINQQQQGTILDALKHDQDNQFYYSLINKITTISTNSVTATSNVKSLASYFHGIARNNQYVKYFTELGYWSIKNINQSDVIELYHQDSGLKTLSLYIKEQDLVIVLAMNTSGIKLSLDDPRIRNLVEKIIQL